MDNRNIKKFIALVYFFLFMLSCSFDGLNPKKSLLNKRKSTILLNEGDVKAMPKFISLSPGDVKPLGWLKDYADDAANGITGHLDEQSATFREAWKGKGFVAKGTNPDDGTGWALEQCSYWFDGAIRLGYILNDTALISKISRRLDNVVDGVLSKGETFIYWKPKEFLCEDGFNSWAHSHIGRALVAYYQGSGNKRILEALEKVYCQFPLPALPDSFDYPTGAVNVDAMIQTYQMTGNQMILDNILKMTKNEKYERTLTNWNNSSIPYGHGVNTYENIRVPAMVYQFTGNKIELNATEACIRWIEENNVLPCGVAATEEFMARIGSAKNIETCNIATSSWTYQQLYQITGQSTWGDKIERIFFNAGPAPVSRDYSVMSYYHSPNRIQNVIPVEIPKHPNIHADPENPDSLFSSYEYRPYGHPTLCCAANLTRVIPNYIMHMWLSTMDNGIAAALYGPSVVETVAGEQYTNVKIISETNYPFDETIDLKLITQEDVKFPLYLRIPDWCNNPLIEVNGKLIDISAHNGFVQINRSWKNEDNIKIHFPMHTSVIEGHEAPYPEISYYQHEKARPAAKLKDMHNPYESIFYGPLLFALPLADKNPNEQVSTEKWNYALAITDDTKDIKIFRKNMPDRWTWSLDSPIKLIARATTFNWNPSELQPLPKEKIKNGDLTSIELVPYGCTKFRVSMFPVSK